MSIGIMHIIDAMDLCKLLKTKCNTFSIERINSIIYAYTSINPHCFDVFFGSTYIYFK